MRNRALVAIVAGFSALLLVLVGVLAWVEHDRAEDAKSANAALQRQLRERREAEQPPSEGQSPSEEAQPGDDALQDLLDGLLGDIGGGSLGGLFGPGECKALTDSLDGGLGNLFDEDRGDRRARDLDQVADKVEEVRQLQFREVPEPKYLSPAELQRRVEDEVGSYPDDVAAVDTRELVALGAIPEGSDIEDLQREALGEQVAGFYDPETKELVVGSRSRSGRLAPSDEVTLAHELDHALTDQGLDLPPILDADAPAPGKEDEALANLAVVEGDATLVMQLYALQTLSFGDQLSMLAGALPSAGELGSLPPYLQRQLVFPYVAGLGFVCKVHDRGGWAAVNEAYKKLPTTTAQILFPDRYFAGEGAEDPSDTGSPGEGWKDEGVRSLGAAELLWLFEAPGGDTDDAVADALKKVEAWGGGEVKVWSRGADTALGVSLKQRRGGAGLCDAVKAWSGAAVDDNKATVTCNGDDVRVGIAPDEATAKRLAR